MKKKIFAATAIFLLVATFVLFKTSFNDSVKATQNNITFDEVSWAISYDDLGGVTGASDTIVVGQIVGIDSQTRSVLGQPRWGTEYLYHTDYKFRVVQVLKGTANGDILVRQTGMFGKQELREDPLMRVGEQYILFLREWKSGSYSVVAGPEGRFKLINDKVYSMDIAAPDRNIELPQQLQANGLTKATFVESVSGILSEQ